MDKMAFRQQLQLYYRLSKPGIIYANLLTAIAGYLLASRWHIVPNVFVGLCVGLVLTIASACSYNNYLDRGIDKRMQRTKSRSLVTGSLRGVQALSFATICAVGGITVSALTQNLLTTSLLVIALLDYVVLYGIGKRKTVHGTLIGCLAGAIPLVAGYTAVHGRIDATAWLLLALMVAWQMAHFYGIALYRLTDYQKAGLPVMPAIYGERSTQRQALGYIVVFMALCAVLITQHTVGIIPGAVLLLLATAWFVRAYTMRQQLAFSNWGKQTFLFSLIVILGMSLVLSIGRLVA